jgi:hypothetical protein
MLASVDGILLSTFSSTMEILKDLKEVKYGSVCGRES